MASEPMTLAGRTLPAGVVRKLYATPDGIDRDKYLLVRYRISANTEADLRVAASRLALLTSLGTIDALPYENDTDRLTVGPRILETHQQPGSPYGDILIALPIQMFGTGTF